jgi:hypothetical protein
MAIEHGIRLRELMIKALSLERTKRAHVKHFDA